MNRTKDMTQGNPTRLIFSFALPLILGNLGQQLYMITDAVIVGRGVGVHAFAALGATDWAYWLILWTIQARTQGFAILVTQHIGYGDDKSMRKSITMSIFLCGIFGVALTATGILAAKPLLSLLQTPGDIFAGAASYVTIMYTGTMIVMTYNMASAILRAFGDGKSPLIAMVIAAVVNILLDLLLVIGFNMGIAGAAVATLIAQSVASIYCIFIIRKIPLTKTNRGDWLLEKTTIKTLISLGLPLALQHVAIALGGLILQHAINGYGSLFIAGFTATNKLYGMLESSAISFGFATSTYVAQNWGANRIDRIGTGMKSAVKLSAAWSVGISLLMILFGKSILHMFVASADPNAAQVVDIAYQYLFIMSTLLVFLYMIHIIRSALQGLGDTIAPMVSGFFELLARIAVVFILPIVIGQNGLFFAEPAAWFFCFVYVAINYCHRINKIRRKGLTFSNPSHTLSTLAEPINSTCEKRGCFQ